MFCPKCGAQAEYGKFCRSCGTNLAIVSEAISGQMPGQLSASSSSGGTTLALFGPAAIANEARDLAQHKAIAVFGEVTVDLTAAALPIGETSISAYTIFGSINILVPDEVGIRITGLTALSEVKVRGEEARKSFFDADEYTSPNYHEASRRLHVEAACLFAGIKLRR